MGNAARAPRYAPPAPSFQLQRDPEAYARVLAYAEKIGPIQSPYDVWRVFREDAEREDTEVAYVLLLDTYLYYRGKQEIARQARDRVSISLPDAMRSAIYAGTRYLVLTHTHPSGDATPSEDDEILTAAVEDAAKCVDLYLLDHIVLGFREIYSFRRRQLFPVA